MSHSLPTLRVLPVENMLLPENHDPLCAVSLKESLRSEGLLRNPPVVVPLKYGASRFVVLDGANRTIALRTMGYPHVLAQVVEPQKNICLKSWNHILLHTDTNNFIACVQNIPDLHVCRSQNLPLAFGEQRRLCSGWQ